MFAVPMKSSSFFPSASQLVPRLPGLIPGSGRSTGEGIKQELHGLEEASISDSEVVRDGDDEHYKTKERYETVCPHLLARSLVQQKDGAKKARKSRESSGTKEAKEKRSAPTLQPG